MAAPVVLDQVISIQRRGTARDAAGQRVEAWTDVCTGVWANVRMPTGSQAIRAGADVATARVSIRIRWRAGLDAGMRVVHGSAVYDIKSPPLGTRHGGYLDLVCEGVDVSS